MVDQIVFAERNVVIMVGWANIILRKMWLTKETLIPLDIVTAYYAAGEGLRMSSYWSSGNSHEDQVEVEGTFSLHTRSIRLIGFVINGDGKASGQLRFYRTRHFLTGCVKGKYGLDECAYMRRQG
jgi:hypothetical protein